MRAKKENVTAFGMKFCVVSVFLSQVTLSYALLATPQVMSGNADCFFKEFELNIQVSDFAELNWSDFSIATNESVLFIQPSKSSLVVNRVVGDQPSLILGSLSANGQVILLNPQGVIVGKEAKVNVGSLIASTLDLQNQLFLENRELQFTGSSKSPIEIYGHVEALENISLIGHTINMKGSLKSHGGTVALFGVPEVLFKGEKGNIYMFSKCSFDLKDHSSVALHGSIHSQNEKIGGKAVLLADFVTLQNGGLINVSGEMGGGTVLIGGDYQGKGELNRCAQWVDIHPKTSIFADSQLLGNGGKVIVWSERGTQNFGSITAQGGKMGGNGGLVEVSGKWLNHDGVVSCSAPNGIAGEILFDPTDLTVAAATQFVTGLPTIQPNLMGFPATINAATVIASLAAGNNVTLLTTNDAFAGNGDIIFNASVSWFGLAGSLTIDAWGSVLVNAAAGANIGPLAAMNTGNLAIITRTGDLFVTNDSRINNRLGTLNVTVARNILINWGRIGNAFASATPNGLVTVFAGGDICLVGALASQMPGASTAAMICSDFSEVRVVAEGSILLRGGETLNSRAHIGTQAGNITNTGNIRVTAAGDIVMMGGTNNDTDAVIGGSAGTNGNNLAGRNITVRCGGDLTMFSGLGQFGAAVIGSGAYDDNNFITSNINVTVGENPIGTITGGNLVMNGAQSAKTGHHPVAIGFLGTPLLPNIISGSVNVTVHGNAILNSEAVAPPCVNPCPGCPGFMTMLNPPPVQTVSTNAQTIIGSLSTIGNPANIGIQVNLVVDGNLVLDGRMNYAAIIPNNDGVSGPLAPISSVITGGDFILIGSNGVVVTPERDAAEITMNGAPLDAQLIVASLRGSIVAVNGLTTGGNIHAPGFPGAFTDNIGQVTVIAANDIRIAGGTNTAMGGNVTTYYSSGGITYESGVDDMQGGILVDTFRYNTAPFPTAGTIAAGGVNILNGTFISNPGSPTPNVPLGSAITYSAQNGSDISFTSTDLFSNGAIANFVIDTAAPLLHFDNTQEGTYLFDGGSITVQGFFNTTIRNHSLIAPAFFGNILVNTENRMFLENAIITAGAGVTLVTDNQRPNRPLYGSGGIEIDALSQINYGEWLRIFTAIPEQNNISLNALFNGISIGALAGAFPGPFLQNSLFEVWCTYYSALLGDVPPFSGSFLGGVPFTVFYKPCLEQLTYQATVVVVELLVGLHPYNEFPGWDAQFFIDYYTPSRQVSSSLSILGREPYLLRRRHLHLLNHAKTWTWVLPESKF